MKRKYILCAVSLAALLLGGCAGSQQNRLEYIGAEQAKQLALQASGLSAAEVDSLDADLSSHDGKDYYQVDFESAGQSYQYDIDALTGVVIDSQLPSAGTDEKQGAGTDKTAQTVQNTATVPQQPADSGADSGSSSDSGAKKITEGKAKNKALAHAGLSSSQVNFVKCKLDYDDGREVYDVEFYTKDYKEYDYEIDAYTGEVISYDYDADSYTPPAGSGGSEGSAVTADKARELALGQVPGAAADNIVEFETDYDDGHTEYEGKIIYNGMEYEFEIDAYSGAFRKWEVEPVD